jgi:hypothetical protein
MMLWFLMMAVSRRAAGLELAPNMHDVQLLIQNFFSFVTSSLSKTLMMMMMMNQKDTKRGYWTWTRTL